MKKIIDILMQRDGLTRDEAKALLLECVNEIRQALAEGEKPDTIEDIWQLHTGLESDYLIAIF